ncbi:MAG TPA: RNA 2',3'-cyclic phosphodiesterase [Streptosporangiaceae bacterium]|nr:RNA 2',3'-cyclic phosphodiesterase [Streptosporangiaceae bacterium]
MRLFVALSPPQDALAELEVAVAPLRSSWPELRWVGADRWHVTLAFLGEVDDGKLAELNRRLERAAARHAGNPLAIGPGHAFSSIKRARVLIARIEGETQALADLAASVAAGARRAGAPSPDEGRKYRPHLTLARTRQPMDLSGPVAALGGFKGQAWTPTEVHLIRSVLGSRPRYETAGSWPLKA